MRLTFLLGTIGVVLAAPIGYYMIYAPQQRQASLIYAQLAQEQATRQARTEVAALLEQVERYRTRLPEEPDPSWLARAIVAAAQQVGVEITGISQEPPQGFEQTTRLSVAVDLDATYHQLGTLLDRVERATAFIRVEHIAITRAGNEDRLSIRVVFSTLHLPPLFAHGP